MKGAIVGDILGSPHEFLPEKEFNFELINRFIKYTDDSVLTIAVADALLNNLSYDEALVTYSRKYPNKGYGGNYRKWIDTTFDWMKTVRQAWQDKQLPQKNYRSNN